MKSLKNRYRNNSHINFARNCMIQLLEEKLKGLNDISSDDLIRIEQILSKYKK